MSYEKSENAFSLNKSNILSWDKEVALSIFDAFADDNSDVAQITIFLETSFHNIVRIGELYVPFPTMFSEMHPCYEGRGILGFYGKRFN